MPRRIVNSRPIPISEVKRILEEREQSLNSLQLRTLSYAKKYSKLTPEQADALINRLMSEYGLEREEAVQVADICPETIDELRTVLSGYRRLVSFLLFSEEKMRGILGLVKHALEASKQQI
ncbi:MAG: RNA polymerase Rpb4 family protein [Nitrososphaerota archaeon]